MAGSPRFIVLLMLSAAATHGCRGATPDDSDIVPEGALPEFASDLAQALCERDATCLSDEQRLVETERCTTSRESSLDALLLGHVAAAVEDGTIVYDPTALDACAAALRAAACELDVSALPAECEELFEGLRLEGESCRSSFECAGDLACVQSGDERCDALCTRLSSVGEACEVDSDCRAGLACAGEPASCRTLGSIGSACGAEEVVDCADGLLCALGDPALAVVGECRLVDDFLVAGVGVPCDPDTLTLCARGLQCAPTACDESGCDYECVDAPGSGGTCTLGFLPVDPCPPNEHCRVTGPEDADLVTGRCEPLPVEGEGCAGFECAGDLVCVQLADDESGLCARPLANGEACMEDEQCRSLTCRDVCVPPPCAWETW